MKSWHASLIKYCVALIVKASAFAEALDIVVKILLSTTISEVWHRCEISSIPAYI